MMSEGFKCSDHNVQRVSHKIYMCVQLSGVLVIMYSYQVHYLFILCFDKNMPYF